MDGSAARIRVSSVMAPPPIGTLKSTRTKTRFPATSASRTDRILIRCPSRERLRSGCPGNAGFADERDEIGNSAGITPFIVVPRDDLGSILSDHHRRKPVDD